MTGFTDLPPEILLQIWVYVRSTDIDSFSLVSQNIRALGTKQLTEHEYLKRKYSIVWSDPRNNEFMYLKQTHRSEESMDRYLVTIIKDILLDPRVASYVQKLCIGDFVNSWIVDYIYDEQGTRRDQTNTGFSSLVEAATAASLPRSLRNSLHNLAASWLAQIDRGSEDPVIGLLLFLLPELRTIQWEPYIEEPKLCLAWIRRIALDPTALALSCLTNFELAGPTPSGPDDLTPLTVFAALPSLRRIFAKQVGDSGAEYKRLFECKVSHVEELIMEEANIHAGTLFDFLGIFKALKTFHYEPCQHCEDGDKYHVFDPSLIRNALVAYARESLTHLKLRARHRPRTLMGSLRNFTVLATLETDWGLLVPDSPGTERLLHALPCSIKQIHLHTDDSFTPKYSTDQIRHLLKNSRGSFPDMVELHISHLEDETSDMLGTALLPVAATHGVRLSLDTTPDADAPFEPYGSPDINEDSDCRLSSPLPPQSLADQEYAGT